MGRLVLFVLVSVGGSRTEGAVSKDVRCVACEGGGRVMAPVVARCERM